MEARHWGGLYVALGVVAVAVAVGHLLTISWAAVSLGHLLIDVVVLGAVGLCLVYGGYWHLTRPLPDERYPRLFGWVVAGTLVFVAVALVSLYVGSTRVTVAEATEALRVAGGTGVLAGLLVGTVEATAIVNSRAAARAEAEAAALEAEARRVKELNAFLRHYLRNSLTVISGHTEYLSWRVPAEDTAKVDAIDERVETIATLVDHVGTLSLTRRDDAERRPYAVEDLLDGTRDAFAPSQRVTVEASATGSVSAPESFDEGIGLLCEALSDVLDPDCAVTVTAREDGSRVAISVATAPPAAVTRDAFAAAGPETKVKFALAEEFVGPSGTVRLGEDPDDELAVELVVEVADDAEPTGPDAAADT